MTAPKRKIKKRQTLADQLYGQVLEQIVSNKLAQGEKLPSENQIATAFGVSRPVVREALRKLQEDGLVEARRGVGTFVRRRPSEKLIEYATAGSVAGLMRAMEARITIEKATARMAAQRASPKDIARIEAALQTLEASMQARDPSFDADYQFHRAIAAASASLKVKFTPGAKLDDWQTATPEVLFTNSSACDSVNPVVPITMGTSRAAQIAACARVASGTVKSISTSI